MLDPPKGLVTVLLTSLVSYLVFHTYEPRNPILITSLLIFVPAALSKVMPFHDGSVAFMLVAASYWSLLATFTIAYRISSFHPLAKYPGPILDRISKLRAFQVSVKGDGHRHRQKLHQKYGDIVRIGPDDLSYANVDGVQQVLGPNGLPKSMAFDHGPNPSIVMIRNPAEYGPRRRLWNKAFSSASLKHYEEHVLNRSRELIDHLSQVTAKPIDISKWMEFFAFDVMGNVAFNISFTLTKAGKDERGYRRIIMSGTRIAACLSHVPWLNRLFRFFVSPTLFLHRLSKPMVGERLKAGSTAKDLFYYLGQDDEERNGLDQDQLIGEGTAAIVAGSDTTSTTMANLWYCLLKNPQYYARLRQEVDEAFPFGEEPVDHQRLASMSYLNACIDESMRLFHPVISGSERTVPHGSGGRMVGSHYIPEGTNITIHPYTIQRDSRYFSPYPTIFWPDRWLAPADRRSLHDINKPLENEVNVVTNMEAFIPFSTGPRNCPGKNLGMMEMRVVVSYIVQRFDMKVAEGYDLNEWESRLRDYFILMKGPLRVVLTPRVLVV